ncbi:ArsR/SmtB family transcription factor [Halomonas sp. V046]|uniref:ArsR/SmtB family transcription factor n=1 Tax=Halomonas sp. V046 TaxID=3459611 RepID=UPI004044C251
MPITPRELLRIAANKERFAILETLESHGEMNVTAIAAELSVIQPTISKHLRLMRNALIVDSRREGVSIYYRVADDPAVLELIEWQRRHR